MEKKGILASGRAWEIIPSAKSAVEKGQHWILHTALEPTIEEKGELLSLAYLYASE